MTNLILEILKIRIGGYLTILTKHKMTRMPMNTTAEHGRVYRSNNRKQLNIVRDTKARQI